METIELKFLLTLLGYRPDYRSLVSSLNLTKTAADRDRISRQLRDRGLIEALDEITSFKTAPAGKALLKLDAADLPITTIELSALQQAEHASIAPDALAEIRRADRQTVLKSLADRGFIQVMTRPKEVWLTEHGKAYLRNDYVPQGNQSISLNLLGHYIIFMRQTRDAAAIAQPTAVEQAIDGDANASKPGDREVLHLIQTLDHELGTENYLPLFHLRQKLQPLFMRDELDQMLYRLQRQDHIELSSLQEAALYTPDQVDAGIPQDIGGPLFFISISTDI